MVVIDLNKSPRMVTYGAKFGEPVNTGCSLKTANGRNLSKKCVMVFII